MRGPVPSRGRRQVVISTMASALPYARSGKMRLLAVTTAQRSSFFPELPTMDTYLRSEVVKWAKVVKSSGATPE